MVSQVADNFPFSLRPLLLFHHVLSRLPTFSIQYIPFLPFFTVCFSTYVSHSGTLSSPCILTCSHLFLFLSMLIIFPSCLFFLLCLHNFSFLHSSSEFFSGQEVATSTWRNSSICGNGIISRITWPLLF